MMIYLLKRTGPLVVNALLTAITVLSSIIIVIILDLLILGYIDWNDVLIGTLTPLILSWILTGQFISLLQRLQRTEDELQALANEDHLTGLLNRRRFLELAEQEWRRARRYGHPLTALMVDADHFKAVNDTYGHQGGDTALRSLAQILREALRDSDLVGRYGGEEFAVLLPHTDSAGGQAIAERIRADVAARPIPFDTAQIALTISIGMAADTPDCANLDRLLARADHTLYLAKERGRNQVAS